MSRKEALSTFIQQIHARPVVVKLNSGVDYRGMGPFFHPLRKPMQCVSPWYFRGFGVPGRLHEHRPRTNRRIRKRSAEKQIWGRFYTRQQRLVHQHSKTTLLSLR